MFLICISTPCTKSRLRHIHLFRARCMLLAENKMAKVFISVLVALLAAVATARDYTNSTQLDGENYKLWWTYDNSSGADSFYFKVEVLAKGWIGFGFSLLQIESWMREAMTKYDVLVAGVYNNGTVYSEDYLTSYLNVSQYPAHADKKNNWVITESEEKDGKTILEFNRKRVTDDIMTNAVPAKGDIALTPGLRYFVWAYHEDKDTPYLDNINLKHTKSGLQEVMLIKEVEHEEVHHTFTPKNNQRSSKATSIPPLSLLSFLLGSLLTLVTACLL